MFTIAGPLKADTSLGKEVMVRSSAIAKGVLVASAYWAAARSYIGVLKKLVYISRDHLSTMKESILIDIRPQIRPGQVSSIKIQPFETLQRGDAGSEGFRDDGEVLREPETCDDDGIRDLGSCGDGADDDSGAVRVPDQDDLFGDADKAGILPRLDLARDLV